VHEAVTAVLATSYDLRDVLLRPIAHGSRPVFRVDSASGRFVIKCYAAERESLDALARSDAGSARAVACGLPTAPIVANREGRRATDGGDVQYVLYRHIDGRHHGERSFTTRAAAHLGGVIGGLERAFAGLDHGDLRPDNHWPMDIHGGLARLTALLREAERSPHPTGCKSASALRSRIEALEGLAGEMRGLADLPLQWVHGDCNPENILFDADDNVTAVLDFDNLSRLPRGFDFMYALNQSFRSPDACARSALQAYLDELRPPRTEIEGYPVMWLYCDMQIIWNTTYVYMDPQTRQEREGSAATPAPPWWLANWREMTAFFLATYDAWATGG